MLKLTHVMISTAQPQVDCSLFLPTEQPCKQVQMDHFSRMSQ